MLKCKDISLSAGDKHLFDLNELALDSGLFAIVGRNGAGKSTFLNAILGESAITKGQIHIDGRNVEDLKAKESNADTKHKI